MTRASPSANEDTIRKKEEKRKAAADIAEQTVTLTCSQMAAALSLSDEKRDQRTGTEPAFSEIPVVPVTWTLN